ncbi:hypothetical protein GQ55_5G299800 [Panicum hallii var. hallii]|uniref:Reverse transcriptase zinc-binding domain-containing protein n=1 Tax=Panicum hallii var. hallii TaxID=1504633 RepID=A0A2T7DLH6_9POAL|nr:hypothetical protein GQ55_5G299800 [Panicum hallii var. hallii]
MEADVEGLLRGRKKAASTTIHIGDGAKTSFWHNGWVHGQRPRDLAPNIFKISKKKDRMLREALQNQNWIKDLNLNHPSLSVQHFQEFVSLWRVDGVVWKLTADGIYSAKSAYNARFMGSTLTNFDLLILRVWAPQSCKLFSWLAIQNRTWTADILQNRGWPNQTICPLPARFRDSTTPLCFVDCRFARRIWENISVWTANPDLHPREWTPADSIHQWWTAMANSPCASRRGLRSLIMLTFWVIWKERNARIFDRKEWRSRKVFQKIQEDLACWMMAGAKHLSILLSRS